MSIERTDIRIRIIAFSNHDKTSSDIINNFNELLVSKSIFGRKWGFVRKKVDNKENAFYLGGGRMRLPKRQITFDNLVPPLEVFDEKNNLIENNIIEYCNSADIFLFCIDILDLPETWRINRLAYNIKQADREKTILYAVRNTNTYCSLNLQSLMQDDFDKYANFVVTQHIELINSTIKGLSEETENLIQHGYLFPYTDTQCFVTRQNRFIKLRNQVFCFGEIDSQRTGYVDCLLYCINLIYSGENMEIAMTNNKLYHYLTTNINFKSYNNMANKKIKLAVVGAADNGKSHFISDVFRALQLMGINYSVKNYTDYAQVAHYLNQIVGKKEIMPTDVVNLTRNEHHYKGELPKLGIDIEFMDIPGEAFMNAENISGTYQNIKDVVRDCYTNKQFLGFSIKKQPFVEEYRTQGKSTKITLSLNNKIRNNEIEIEKKRTKDSNSEQHEEQDSYVFENKKIENKPNETKYVSGEYVHANFEKYETDNLKSVLKQIVEEQKENISYPSLKQIDNDFWQNFYAYVFCDNCNDIILCELLALPKSSNTDKSESSKKAKINESDFTNCLNGIKTFFNNKTPRMYVIFKGLDAMLKYEDDTFKNMFGNKKGNSIIKCTSYIYLLIHLAIYKKYMTEIENVSEKFDDLLNKIINNEESGFLKDENIRHLFDETRKELRINLDDILLDKSYFELPRDNSKQGIESHLAARIADIQNFDNERFDPAKDINSDSFANFILPHIYFTAYPIDAINLTVHKNSSINRQSFDGLNVEQRLPLGTFNFIADFLNANGISDHHKGSDMENLLYKNN